VREQLKRAATLALYWKGADLVCENYRTQSRAAVSVGALGILNFFARWNTRDRCARHLPIYPRPKLFGAIDRFVKLDFLVRKQTEQATTDADCERAWADWLPEAGLLHFGTKDTRYVEGLEELHTIQDLVRDSPQPSSVKTFPNAPRIGLPKPAAEASGFRDVLFGRRTHRRFSNRQLPLRYLSALLHDTWGVARWVDTSMLGRLPLKTSPSGGARHPEEVYVIALRVEGLARGTYHYLPDQHCLERIQDDVSGARSVEFCGGQNWVGDAAALFVMTAVFARTMWKYPFSRAYRVVLAEAGHLCQTFCLVACSLGLGPFSTMALSDSLLEAHLGINGFNEAVLYVAGVGFPAP
jgi:SagB-type dehydrogenase family enzyme